MKSQLTSLDPLARLSEEQVELLAQRLEVTRTLASKPQRSRYDVELAAEQLGVHASTLYRDMGRLEGRGSVEDLAPRAVGYPKGRSKLLPRQEELIMELLQRVYLTPARPSMVQVTLKIGDACEDEGLPRPSRATVIRRRDALPKRTVVLKREGQKAAEQQTPRPGKYEVKEPWGVWQIDHTLVDVIVVDENGKPIGRVWLTVVIDVCTRMIVAFYVGLEPPSTIRVATTLDLAVAPKGPWLAARGLDYPWPADGLGKLLHSDRAKEFTRLGLRKALLNEGMATYLRPPGRTRFGGHVERLIGTLMGTCRALPGATYNSPSARGNYDSKGSARLTIDQLEMYFAHQILGNYHQRVHAELGVSPLEAWTQRTAGRTPDYPQDWDAFRLNLLPEMKRTIGRQGIKAFSDEYFSREIGEAYIGGLRDVVIKYDPRDLSTLYVKIPDRGYVAVPYRLWREGPAPTLWLYKAVRKTTIAAGSGTADRQAIRRATAAAEQVIHQAASRSGKVARQAERLRRDRLAPPLVRSTPQRALPPPKDDWGGAFEGDE